MVLVGVNGFGTIGKRVADAIDVQSDMEVAGVAKRSPDRDAWIATHRGYDLYPSDPDRAGSFRDANIAIAGELRDLVAASDVMVDATPSGVAEQYVPLYKATGTPAIIQGGEASRVADVSFNSSANFDETRNAMVARVVSCNTTGLARTLTPLHDRFDIDHVRATLIRRGGDPDQYDRGPINDILPCLDGIPSHHAPDLQTVLPDVSIDTLAVKVPTTLMHLQLVNVSVTDPPREAIVRDTLFEEPRIFRVPGTFDAAGTAALSTLGEDLLRPRGDLWETCVWADGIQLAGDELYLLQAIDQRCNVVPETIDAIRAITKLASRDESVAATNRALGIGLSPELTAPRPA